ncbi:hypothetical protein ACFSRY_17730 [Pontibacter locisalis]|uniref:Uncharacterized protein n=1 Tax=Pontibacter locisalis TaxID=1719035 RepID=A0ABW5IRX4_9BACT
MLFLMMYEMYLTLKVILIKMKFLRINDVRLLITLCFCGFSYFAIAQTPVGSLNQNHLFGNDGFIKTVDLTNSEIKGSPYFFDKWLDASVETSNNQIFADLKLKYNVHLNEILLLKPSGDSVALIPTTIRKFVVTDIKNQEVEFKRFDDLKTNDASFRDNFFVVLHEGETSLLQEVKVKILRANLMSNSGYGVQKRSDEFKREEKYFFVDKNLKPVEVKLNKKNLLMVLNDKENEIKNFISKEKIDTSSEKDWIKTLMFYETL